MRLSDNVVISNKTSVGDIQVPMTPCWQRKEMHENELKICINALFNYK